MFRYLLSSLSIFVLSLTLGSSAFSADNNKPIDGAKIYRSKCSGCHGQRGVGTAMGPAHKGSDFIKNSSKAEIKKVVVDGRKGSEKKYPDLKLPMPPWGGKLSDEKINAVVDYMKTL